MKLSVFILLTFLSLTIYGQETNEQVLYIVDSIPIFENLTEEEGSLSQDIIESTNVVTNKADFGYYKIFDFDKLIFIFTKEYAKRPLEVKKIPSFKKMYEKEGKWCLVGSPFPYSGDVIDYYYTGIKCRDTFLKDGIEDGPCNNFYKDGSIKSHIVYTNGKENGESLFYFPNGQIQHKGVFKNGKEDGIWQERYSTGVLKREIIYKGGKAKPTKIDLEIYSLIKKGIKSFYKKDFEESVSYYNKAIELNPNNSDAYFYRGRAFFFNHSFEEAITNFDNVVELEPLYMEAYGHRAFTRIRKYELKDYSTISEVSDTSGFASAGKAEIPFSEKEKVCFDLKKAIELGDTMKLIVYAIKTYCE
jgi:antitoxin component YwqK of YwqJK toxin-antitoxin module